MPAKPKRGSGREVQANGPPDEVMAAAYTKHLARVQAWLASQPNISVLDIDYNDLLAAPRPGARSANHFLNDALDIESMVSAVKPELYRNRIRGEKQL